MEFDANTAGGGVTLQQLSDGIETLVEPDGEGGGGRRGSGRREGTQVSVTDGERGAWSRRADRH